MDRQVIEQKLESLRRCLARIRQKTPATVAELERNPDAQDVLTLNLTRAVQLSVDIGTHLIASSDQPAPDTMGQTFDVLASMSLIGPELALRMKKAVGFRNIAIHSYEAIDWQITHLIATRHIEDFSAFATAIVDFMEKHESTPE
ncbi:MAG: type VII toxin-antitoxin system HepT family RNase toxin [Thiobacillus sp.]